MNGKIVIHWFRRDLRLNDNTALYHALRSGFPVLPVFLFDRNILDGLKPDDRRVSFIYNTLCDLDTFLRKHHSALSILSGTPEQAFKTLIEKFDIAAVYTNRDYEPYATNRDSAIAALLRQNNIPFFDYKDQVIFERLEISKPDSGPYTIYTPYANRWKQFLNREEIRSYPSQHHLSSLYRISGLSMPGLQQIGFRHCDPGVFHPDIGESLLAAYSTNRNLPYLRGTNHIGTHLRFGLLSIRELVKLAARTNEQWLNELIWREFFMMILANYPEVENSSFRSQYDRIRWRNNEREFVAWCKGETGYPIVDAGMRQLNEIGWMHNRVRMITASFLCKHLLTDWRWGEAYFAEKLLDYELASNNGNWQWAAGSGCDAAPYFRIFNPEIQTRKFDPGMLYIRTWIKDFDRGYSHKPIVDHQFARQRALEAYKAALRS